VKLAALTFTIAAATQAADIPITLTKPGNISTAIYDSQGRMLRELARAEPMQSGKLSLAWDGLDMDGKPMPAGKYEWRSLQTQGLRSEYLMSVGTSVGERWWRNPLFPFPDRLSSVFSALGEKANS
jgi:hypothetical protein